MQDVRGLSVDAVWDYENGRYGFSHPTRFNKLFAHYELYKTIVHLPGDVLEFGGYKGASLIRLATFRNTLENDFSRRIVGFDAFGKFPTKNLSLSSDEAFIERFEIAGGDGLDVASLNTLIAAKGFQNTALVKGNVFDTLPEYLSANPQTRVAFLHLDMDVREPTTFVLEHLFDRVVPGGLIVLDDYNAVAGETDALDEFIRGRSLAIEKLPFYKAPAFVRKPV